MGSTAIVVSAQEKRLVYDAFVTVRDLGVAFFAENEGSATPD